jgi:hypothetical protein
VLSEASPRLTLCGATEMAARRLGNLHFKLEVRCDIWHWDAGPAPVIRTLLLSDEIDPSITELNITWPCVIALEGYEGDRQLSPRRCWL